MLGEFSSVVEGLEFSAPRVPVVSSVSGGVVSGEWCDPGYWVRQVRETVRFGAGVECLVSRGVVRCVEIGPDAVLTPMAADSAPEVVFTPACRKDRDEARTVVTAVATLHVHGTPVDWSALFTGTGARWVELPTYAFQRERYWPTLPETSGAALARELSVVDEWRYGVDWLRWSGTTPGVSDTTWLVVGSAEQLAHPLVAALEARGVRVERLTADRLDRVELGRDIEKIVAEFPERAALSGVLSLLGLAEEPQPGTAVLPSGLAGTLSLAQAMGDVALPAPLWCVTRGAVAVGETDALVSATQAQLWGLGRVVGLEQPQRWGGLIDLPETLDESACDRVCGVLSGTEDQVAVRSSGVYVRRVVDAPASTAEPVALRDTVLITGGTGALAAHVAKWAVDHGAARVVLASRRGTAAPGMAELCEELTSSGARADAVSCDVTDRAALAALVDRLEADGDPVRAVVHAAGAEQLTPLSEVTVEEFEHVLSAKVLGAANLDAVFDEDTLDAFVLFSSISGIWGSGLQAAYAAANAYLDALAQQRRRRGLTATAVAWGPWADGGMADGDAGEHLVRRGLPAMAPRLAITAMHQAISGDDPLVVVADVEWSRFAPAFSAARAWPLFEQLPAARALDGLGGTEPDGDHVAALRSRLAGMTADDQHEHLLELVRAEAAAVLEYAGAEEVQPDAVFRELGFDSLTAVELRGRLIAATGLSLPAGLVFDHPSPDALAQHLRQELAPDAASDASGLLAELDRLEAGLGDAAPDELTRAKVAVRLQAFLAKWTGEAGNGNDPGVMDTLGDASDDEILSFIDGELGRDT